MTDTVHELEEELAPWDTRVFELAGRKSQKIRCIVCGVTGCPSPRWRYGPTEAWLYPTKWWTHAHERGHPWSCSHCDRAYTSSMGLVNHQRTAHRAARRTP